MSKKKSRLKAKPLPYQIVIDPPIPKPGPSANEPMYEMVMKILENHEIKKRTQEVSRDDFKKMLLAKEIRPASLEDVNGTHHKRPLYKHPNTGQYYTKVR